MENVAAKEKSNLPFGIDAERYQELLDGTLVSCGNNARMKKLLEKLRAGDDVYIAMLGGSVTEGAGPANYKDGYAYQFNKKLRDIYTPDGGAHVYFNDAALSGTGSEQGLIRYQTDVVEVLGHTPDLLVIEFAVNDDGKDFGTRAFEALVRGALEQNEDAVVIALYSAAEYGNTMGAKKPVADFYEIPQVNVLSFVQRASASKEMDKKLYFTDNVHPTTAGHTVQADCLLNLFAHVDAAPADEPISVPQKWSLLPNKAFTNYTRILPGDNNSEVKIDAGSFDGTDSRCQSIKKTGKSNFPKNWHYSGAKSGSIKIELSCKAFMLIFKEQASWANENFGKADVYVDGKLVATYDGGNPAGWGNCVPKLLIDEDKLAKHTIEVKMADGNESKPFTIVAMGYTK